tara:strand:+ start:775 stop:1296 length:522 start_codon:yes stop_codon:yes gene_type:complete
MTSPNGVWREFLDLEQSRYVALNLLNLDNWPQWNSTAQRILSSQKGELKQGQRFDLHRIERQQLIEEMWEVQFVRKGDSPEFTEIGFEWLGQISNGKKSGNAIKSLTLEITVLCQDDGGVEIAAWWQISKWSKLIKAKVENSAKQIAKQWLNDLSKKATLELEIIKEIVIKEK